LLALVPRAVRCSDLSGNEFTLLTGMGLLSRPG
jgi:hypothetical protein